MMEMMELMVEERGPPRQRGCRGPARSPCEAVRDYTFDLRGARAVGASGFGGVRVACGDALVFIYSTPL